LLENNGAIQLQRSPAQLALRLMHASSGIYLEHILTFEDNLSDLEDELLLRGSDEMMRQLMSYKSRLVKLRRIFNYHESITAELRNGEYELFSDTQTGLEHTLTDLHDRFERLNSLASLFYDICGDLIDGYLAVTSHQLNNTMRVLTVITAIFVPLSFLAGLYGMNFENIPELHTHDGYFVLLGVMAATATSLLLWFRRLRWV
jgi:magnesium transporter